MESSLEYLFSVYENLENNYPISQNTNFYQNYVRANGNRNYPVQRWFHQKESYSVDLMDKIFSDMNLSPESINQILDPFCGVGSTLLSAQKLAKEFELKNLHVYGLERNPFLHFVAKTKINWNSYSVEKLDKYINRLIHPSFNNTDTLKIPDLTTLHREDVFEREILKKALSIQKNIHNIPKPEKYPLLLGFSSILESISGIRKDGRALRIMPNKNKNDLLCELKLAWEKIAEDLKIANSIFYPIESHIFLGDGRTLKSEHAPIKLKNIDLIMYSPPYLNNIDYTEVYKIELWICGFINNYKEFRELRKQTFRSHPSVSFYNEFTFESDNAMTNFSKSLNAVINALPTNQDLNWRTVLFKGYFDDIYKSLKRQSQVLRPKGHIFLIIGNSLHGPMANPESRVPVASDLLIGQIAESLNFTVKNIIISRYLQRRPPTGKYLRESIIILQKNE